MNYQTNKDHHHLSILHNLLNHYRNPTALILCLNSLYFAPQFDAIKARIMSNGFFRAFGGIVSEPILFIINCVIAVLFITSGIIKFAIRNHVKKA